ncbi:ras-related protein Rab-36 isoform X3 [Artibeus jamaicensis]|uniref:ras-related protein Rab-36 isoform X3 n=1 Tax=Artibeus jamaicensis TaxID=9417 RepID=UPI00235B2932|nr:ras-related protein Rab-36 isoform X3 [Artibeus jamaicensis]
MRSSLLPLGPPVSRDRIIASFPKWYTPDACLQLKEHFHGQVHAACQQGSTGTVGASGHLGTERTQPLPWQTWRTKSPEVPSCCLQAQEVPGQMLPVELWHELQSYHPQPQECRYMECKTLPELSLSKVVVVGDLYVGKTSLIHRFCKNIFDCNYKATIGVDFEIERFEIAGIPYSLQIWDTAGQEKFKCIASAYYRGAQVIITAFDLTDVQTLDHTRQWLEDALRENEPGSCFVFLVGTKKDLLGRT